MRTDHLNNTVVGAVLTNPDQILRMLLKIESTVHLLWTFSPGNTQVGDGFSRNPEDRGTARTANVERPMTLSEVFQVASGATLDGEVCVDHAEEFTSMEVKSLRAVLEGPGASAGQVETQSGPRSRVAVAGQVDSMNESLTGCRNAGLKSSTGPCAPKAGRVDSPHPRE